MSSNTTAIVLFSGGQDSSVCLAHALTTYDHVETVGFDYGQRHSVELSCRPVIREKMAALNPGWHERLGDDHMLDARVLKSLGETAMTHDTQIAMTDAGLPNTFVPGRNLLFLTLAGALAYRRGAGILVGGMCETDYSGYPDCRRETLDAQAKALSLGMDYQIQIDTPLMHINKAATWALADALGGPELIDLIVEETHTCYKGDRTQRRAWGYGCGECPACDLRARGWEEWKASA